MNWFKKLLECLKPSGGIVGPATFALAEGKKTIPMTPARQRLSPKGVEMLKAKEEFRSKPYKDSKGVWTIGYGSTAGVNSASAPITEEEATELLVHHVMQNERDVAGAVKVPLTQNQFDALVLFMYNIGNYAFKQSTLLKKLNARDFEGAAEEFDRWVYITKGGKKVKLNGLVNRRNAEKDLFLNGNYS